MSGRFADGTRLAVGTLTVLPTRAPSRVDRARAGVAMSLAPLAVLPIAIVVAALAYVGVEASVLPAPVVAVLVVATVALGSRAMHLDGLADTADGLTASYDPAHASEVMRRGDTGPAGAVALVLVLLLQVSALTTVLARPWGWLVAATLVCCSRAALALACARGVEAAREEGLGAAVAESVPRPVAALSWAVVAAVCAGAFVLSGRPWWLGPAAAAVTVAVVVVLVQRCRRRLGGISGDVLGAAVELALAALLVTAATG